MKIKLILFLLSLVALPTAQGQNSRFEIIQGAFTWHEAKLDAEKRGGHLATITSPQEWDAIIAQLGNSVREQLLWLGANNDNPVKAWTWVTGEKWEYTRWASPSEPSGVGGKGPENYLLTWGAGNEFWNDGTGLDRRGYMLEVDSRSSTSSTYELIEGNFDWHDAKLDAERKRGHLATITSQQEWDTIKAAIPSSVLEGKVIWIGGSDSRVEGQWEWITGEPWGGFLNWRGGEPNGTAGGGESDYLEMTQLPGSPWNDSFGTERRLYYLLERDLPTPPFDFTLGLVAFYPFNANARDESGSAIHGIPGKAQLGVNRFGDAQGAYYFNGIDSFITFPKAPTTNTDNISMFCWVRPAKLPQWGIALSLGWADGNLPCNGFALGVGDAKAARLQGDRLIGANACVAWVDGNFVFQSTNLWRQIGFVRRSGYDYFYVDGQMVAAQSIAAPSPPTHFGIGTLLGSNQNDAVFNGAIDDVRVYNRALAGAEIYGLFQFESRQPNPPPEPPLINAFTLSRLAFGPSQGFRLALVPPDGARFTIETSTDLKTWTSLITFPTNSGPFEFIDSSAVTFTRRFYRAVRQ